MLYLGADVLERDARGVGSLGLGEALFCVLSKVFFDILCCG
jgi:hypothetical protein